MTKIDFKILSSEFHACGQLSNKPAELARQVKDHLNMGYSLVGVPYAANGFHYQAVSK